MLLNEVELSRSLFPLELVQQVAASTEPPAQILRVDEHVVTVGVQAVGSSVETARQQLAARLTQVAMTYWMAGGGVQPTPTSWPPSPRQIDLTLRLTAEDGQEAHMIVTANPAVHDPPHLFKALSRLPKQAQVVLESTNPIDRMVLSVRVARGASLTDVAGECLRLLLMPGAAAPNGHTEA